MDSDPSPYPGAKVVLIAEDDPNIREMYAHKLTAEGYIVRQAVDGEAALRETVDARPHLILLDVMMPKMSGFVFLKHLRADPEWGAKVPVIFLTNVPPDDEAAKYMVSSTSPLSYLIKSNTTPDELTKEVRKVLGWGAQLTNHA